MIADNSISLRILSFLDADFVALMTQLLDAIKGNIPLVMDFIQYGGFDVIDKAVRIHSRDDYLAVILPKLQRVVLGKLLLYSVKKLRLYSFIPVYSCWSHCIN